MGHCMYVTSYPVVHDISCNMMEIVSLLESMILYASVKEEPKHLFSSW